MDNVDIHQNFPLACTNTGNCYWNAGHGFDMFFNNSIFSNCIEFDLRNPHPDLLILHQEVLCIVTVTMSIQGCSTSTSDEAYDSLSGFLP